MAIRPNIEVSSEVREIIIADAVLIIAFSLTLSGGLSAFFASSQGFISKFVYVVPIVALAVTLSFILHEMMHKFVAQHYGAIAGFRSSPQGLAITLITGAFGFLFGIPGATMIYVHSFTKEQNGIVSLAGPMTNFVVFVVFFYLLYALHPATGSYLSSAIVFTIFISLLLAFFNMLPLYPLDGSKVLAWNAPVYVVCMAVLVGIMFISGAFPVSELAYLLIFAFVISLFARHLF